MAMRSRPGVAGFSPRPRARALDLGEGAIREDPAGTRVRLKVEGMTCSRVPAPSRRRCSASRRDSRAVSAATGDAAVELLPGRSSHRDRVVGDAGFDASHVRDAELSRSVVKLYETG